MKYLFLNILITMMLFSAYIRDNATNTVLNTQTLQMWQDDTNTTSITKDWINAIDFCENLTLASFSDWRLPNINELSTLIDIEEFNPVYNELFTNTSSTNYWSSTSYVKTGFENQAPYINFRDGSINYSSKVNSYYVRCVRDFN